MKCDRTARLEINSVSLQLFQDVIKDTIIDFISGTFSISLDKETTEIVRVSTEVITNNQGLTKHLPDIVLEIRGAERKDYRIHVEIQTTHDGMMDLRMVKYGYLIGAESASKDNDDIRVITIPHQVEIYLEENNRISD